MTFSTKYFGEIEVQDSDIYTFPEGLPGFEDKRNFALIDNSSENSPFKWLQSVEDGNLAFVVVDPFSIVPDYEVDIPEDEIAALEINDINEILLFTVVVIPENIKNISANLLAPIVINTRKNIAKQVTLNNEKYSIRHYIFDKLNSNGGAADASINKKEK